MHAFTFSSEFKRKNEFRRITETLRLHQQQSTVRSSMNLPGQSNGPVVDPLVRILDTRSHQLRVASDLGLWSVAFHTAEEMYQLLSKKRPTQTQLVNYYSNLAKILAVSSNPQQKQLFHAVCVLKHSSLASGVADQAVLAVLAASVSENLVTMVSEAVATPETTEGAEPVQDKAARLVTLTGSGAVPTPESLMSDLIAKDIVSHASEPVRKIYQLMTGDAGALNAGLGSLIASLPSGLEMYISSLQRAALVKVTKDMQRMYSCMRLDKFESLTKDLMPLEESMRLLGQLKRIDQVNVMIDYESRTISFASVVASSASSGVSTAACAMSVIARAAAAIRSQTRAESVMQAAQDVLFDEDAFFTRLEAERKRCEERRNASDSRKEAIEQDQVRKAQELADQLQKAEEERLDADARQRAAEQTRREYLAKKREDMIVKAKAIVEKMIATGGGAEVANMTDDQLTTLGLDKLDQMFKAQFAKERSDRISKRRNESRRLEHTARLIRQAENERIAQWTEQVYEKDMSVFEQMAAEKAEEWRQAAEQKKASINALLPLAELLSEWKGKRTVEFAHKLAQRAEERRLRLAAAMANRSDKEDSEVAPISNMSRDEFKEMARTLPSWKDASPPTEVVDE